MTSQCTSLYCNRIVSIYQPDGCTYDKGNYYGYNTNYHKRKASYGNTSGNKHYETAYMSSTTPVLMYNSCSNPQSSLTASGSLSTSTSTSSSESSLVGMAYQHTAQHNVQATNNNIICANCGGYGHGYKSCNHPVISYGIICYRMFYNADSNSISPRYLMVQRKDSLCYVEFIRGKYEPQNREYLIKLFNNMTENERERIRNGDFPSLWNSMWCRTLTADGIEPPQSRSFTKEFKESHEKFELLKKGFFIKLKNSEELVYFDINYVLENTCSLYDDTEWGFPKGRRNMSENDLTCALREFTEETGINHKTIKVCHDIKPIEEVFSGSNKVRYKHVYYVAKQHSASTDGNAIQLGSTSLYNPCNKIQSKEIKDVRWFTYQEAQNLIRDHNVERKELFKRLNAMIMRTIQ